MQSVTGGVPLPNHLNHCDDIKNEEANGYNFKTLKIKIGVEIRLFFTYRLDF